MKCQFDLLVRGLLFGLALLLMFYAGHVLSGKKRVTCSKAKKVQILMVYPAFREVCDGEQQQQELVREGRTAEGGAELVQVGQQRRTDGHDDGTIDCRGLPKSRLILHDVCKTATVEDCVTHFDTVHDTVCDRPGHVALNGGSAPQRRHLSLDRGDSSVRRVGEVPVFTTREDDEFKDGWSDPPSRLESAFKVIFGGGKHLSSAFAEGGDRGRAEERRDEVGAGRRDCRTVFETKTEVKTQEKCHVETRQECRKASRSPPCRIIKEIFEERRCRIVPREKCGKIRERRLVREPKPQAYREEEEEEECQVKLRRHCTEPVIDFYIFIEGECKTVKERICKKVPKRREIPPPPPPAEFRERVVCRDEPTEECGIVPRQVIHKHCPRPGRRREQCRSVPVQVCQKVDVQVPVAVSRKECRDLADDRPKREQQQVHLAAAVSPAPLAAGCRRVPRQVPRLECKRVPKIKCERAATEAYGLDGRRRACQRPSSPGIKIQSKRSPAPVEEEEGVGDAIARALASPEKRGCRRVGVGTPKAIPRVSPTIICNVG